MEIPAAFLVEPFLNPLAARFGLQATCQSKRAISGNNEYSAPRTGDSNLPRAFNRCQLFIVDDGRCQFRSGQHLEDEEVHTFVFLGDTRFVLLEAQRES